MSMYGNPSDGNGSQSSRPLSSRSWVPRSNRSGSTLSDSSVRTPSTSTHLRHNLGYGLYDDGHSTPRNIPGLQCLFWFKGCEATFNNDMRGATEWYHHVKQVHLTNHWDAQPGQLECRFCGQNSVGWGSIISHAFEHIRAGERRSDSILLAYLEEHHIITNEERLYALNSRRGMPTWSRGYYDDRYYNDIDMAYTLRHTGPHTSPHSDHDQ